MVTVVVAVTVTVTVTVTAVLTMGAYGKQVPPACPKKKTDS